MTESQVFDIPMLETEEIMTCLHERLLGDGAANILPEHLKTPTPAIMMQLSLSILTKLGVEVSALCQPRLSSSMLLKHPDTYINTFKLIHISMLLKQLIPTLGNSFTLNDLTTPRWKKVRKFICTCINYFKSWADNGKVWDEKYAPNAAAEEEHRQLEEIVANNETEIANLKSWHEDNSARRQELTERVEKSQHEVQIVQKRREEKDLLKSDLKKNFGDITAALEKKQKQVDMLNAEKEKLVAQVVASPKRHMDGKHTLSQKMKVWEEKQAEAQGNVRESERVISVMETMGQLITDSTQTAKDNKSIRENMKKIASEKQLQAYEIENHRLTIIEDTQNVTNLKQQIIAARDKVSRMAMRSKQRSTEHGSVMEAHEREKKTLESQAGVIHAEIIKDEADIRSLRKQRNEMEEDFKKEQEYIEEKKQTIMKEMDNFIKRMNAEIDNSEAAKSLRSSDSPLNIKVEKDDTLQET